MTTLAGPLLATARFACGTVTSRHWSVEVFVALVVVTEAARLVKAEGLPLQLVFELHGLILALHHDARFLRNAGALERVRIAFERLVGHYATPAGLQLLGSGPRAPAKAPRKTRG